MVLLVGLGVMFVPGFAAAAAPGWLNQPYGYVVIDQDVREVLAEFGRNLQLPIVISEAVQGRIRGEVRAEKAGSFLDRLASANGLTWYFDGAVLNVSAGSEFATRVIDAGRVSGEAVVAEMSQLGLSDDRFPPRFSPGGHVMTVSGPPAYLAAVDQLIQRMQPVPAVVDNDVRVRVIRGGALTEVMSPRGPEKVPRPGQ